MQKPFIKFLLFALLLFFSTYGCENNGIIVSEMPQEIWQKIFGYVVLLEQLKQCQTFAEVKQYVANYHALSSISRDYAHLLQDLLRREINKEKTDLFNINNIKEYVKYHLNIVAFAELKKPIHHNDEIYISREYNQLLINRLRETDGRLSLIDKALFKAWFVQYDPDILLDYTHYSAWKDALEKESLPIVKDPETICFLHTFGKKLSFILEVGDDEYEFSSCCNQLYLAWLLSYFQKRSSMTGRSYLELLTDKRITHSKNPFVAALVANVTHAQMACKAMDSHKIEDLKQLIKGFFQKEKIDSVFYLNNNLGDYRSINLEVLEIIFDALDSDKSRKQDLFWRIFCQGRSYNQCEIPDVPALQLLFQKGMDIVIDTNFSNVIKNMFLSEDKVQKAAQRAGLVVLLEHLKNKGQKVCLLGLLKKTENEADLHGYRKQWLEFLPTLLYYADNGARSDIYKRYYKLMDQFNVSRANRQFRYFPTLISKQKVSNNSLFS